jgi:hypothetical protein
MGGHYFSGQLGVDDGLAEDDERADMADPEKIFHPEHGWKHD